MPTTRTLTPTNAWSCPLCHQPAPRLPLAVLVAKLTPPGQVPRDRAHGFCVHHSRDSSQSFPQVGETQLRINALTENNTTAFMQRKD